MRERREQFGRAARRGSRRDWREAEERNALVLRQLAEAGIGQLTGLIPVRSTLEAPQKRGFRYPARRPSKSWSALPADGRRDLA